MTDMVRTFLVSVLHTYIFCGVKGVFALSRASKPAEPLGAATRLTRTVLFLAIILVSSTYTAKRKKEQEEKGRRRSVLLIQLMGGMRSTPSDTRAPNRPLFAPQDAPSFVCGFESSKSKSRPLSRRFSATMAAYTVHGEGRQSW